VGQTWHSLPLSVPGGDRPCSFPGVSANQTATPSSSRSIRARHSFHVGGEGPCDPHEALARTPDTAFPMPRTDPAGPLLRTTATQRPHAPNSTDAACSVRGRDDKRSGLYSCLALGAPRSHHVRSRRRLPRSYANPRPPTSPRPHHRVVRERTAWPRAGFSRPGLPSRPAEPPRSLADPCLE